ncbi:HEPN domain-containing protein [Rhodocaloribacter sp.]
MLYAKAGETLAAARYNLEGAFLTTAVNRAYYAAYYAARAALLTIGEAPRTHHGLILRFSLPLVKTGRIGEHAAQTLAYAEELREGADCETAISFDPNAVADLIRDVEAFFEAVDPLLSRAEATPAFFVTAETPSMWPDSPYPGLHRTGSRGDPGPCEGSAARAAVAKHGGE